MSIIEIQELWIVKRVNPPWQRKRGGKLREKKGLTQAQLAANSRLTIKKIQRIERGEGRITYLDMAAIAEQLQVSLHQLLKGIA